MELKLLAFYFAVQRVPLQEFIVLHFFHALGLYFFVARGHVAGSGLPLSLCFRAFQNYVFPRHILKPQTSGILGKGTQKHNNKITLFLKHF
jgi:hypothetical protein